MPAPNAPTSVSATTGHLRATVTFLPPGDDGGAIITGYTVTAVDTTTPANGGQTVTGTNPPLVVTGLTQGDTYHFTVTATNADGTSPASTNSNSVVILGPTKPNPPTAVTAIAGDGQATVSFAPPADNGGAAITSYTVTAIDETNPPNGGQTASGATSPRTVTGLTNGDGYTFQVTATNAQGTSDPSGKSALTVPQSASGPGAPPPPFPDASSFPLTKEINLIQLQDEIAAAVGQTVQTAVTGNYDPAQPISPTNPATFWVAPNTVSSATVTATIAAHVPNPAYGMSNTEVLFQAALQKVLSDPNAVLTNDELQAAVRGLLVRSLIPQGQPA